MVCRQWRHVEAGEGVAGGEQREGEEQEEWAKSGEAAALSQAS